jgi:hypothetical protein
VSKVLYLLCFWLFIDKHPCSIIHASTATEKYSIRRIYNDQVAKLKNAPSEHTFQRWNENGCKFIILAAGGSFFLLVIIAGLEIRWKITTIRFEVLRQVAKMLRQPGTTSGELSLYTPSLWTDCNTGNFTGKPESSGQSPFDTLFTH